MRISQRLRSKVKDERGPQEQASVCVGAVVGKNASIILEDNFACGDDFVSEGAFLAITMMPAFSRHPKVVFRMSLLHLWLARVTTANQMTVSWNFTRNFCACGQILLACWICIPAKRRRWALDSLTFWRIWMLPSMHFHEYWIGRLHQMKVVTLLRPSANQLARRWWATCMNGTMWMA